MGAVPAGGAIDSSRRSGAGSAAAAAAKAKPEKTSRRLKAAAAMSDRSMQSLGVEAAELLIERYETR